MRNLEAFFVFRDRQSGWQDRRKLKKCARKVFRNFAKYLADFLNAGKVDKTYIKRYIKIENRHCLDRLFQKGRGIIVVTAHLGNWELGGMVTSLVGYPVNAVALAHDNPRVNQLFLKQREINGIRVIPLGIPVRRCFSVLSRGELLALLGDRDFSRSRVKINLFGKPTLVPRGPAELCLKTAAPIVPAFMIREPDDTYRLIFEDPIEYQLSGDSRTDLVKITEKIIAVIAKYISRYPEQWYVFDQFWCDS